MNIDLRLLLMVIICAVIILIPVMIIKKSKKASRNKLAIPENGPYIYVEYLRDGGLLEDGKCGWLDVECETGEEQTFTLNFNKKSPSPIIVPLKNAKYRITYRAQSKASLIASGVLRTINERNGAMGAFANAIYDAGELNGQLSSVVVDVQDDFVLKLQCTTDGLQKSCQVIS